MSEAFNLGQKGYSGMKEGPFVAKKYHDDTWKSAFTIHAQV